MRAEQIRMLSSALKIAVFVVLIAALSNAAFANGLITNLNVSNKQDCVLISVTGETPLNYSVQKATSGKYIVFQFPNLIAQNGRVVSVLSGNIYNIKYSNFSQKPQISRIVVNTKSYVNYSSKWSADKKQITITLKKQGVAVVKPANKTVPKAVKKTYSQSDSILEAVAKAQESVEETPQEVQNETSVSEEPVVEENAVIEEPAAAPEEPATIQDEDVVNEEPAAIPQETTVSEEQPVVQEESPVEAIQPAEIAPKQLPILVPAKKTYVKPAKKVSLNFLGADINDVLKALAQQSGMNIVAGKEVTGNITISLSNVSIENALDYVAKISGFSYILLDNTYIVGLSETLSNLSGKPKDTITSVVKLAYAKADDVIALTQGRYPDVKISKIGVESTGKVGLDNVAGNQAIILRNNMLVLIGPGESVASAKSMIEMFEDALRMQTVETTRKIYKVKYVSAKELANTMASMIPGILISFAPSEGFQLSAPSGITSDALGSSVTTDKDSGETATTEQSSNQSASAGDGGGGSAAGMESRVTSVEKKSRPQALIIMGREIEVDRAIELAQELDVKSPQIKIEAKITSLNKSGADELGIKWNWSSYSVKEGFDDFVKTTGIDGEKGNIHNSAVSQGIWLRQPFNFAGVLDAVFTRGNGNLLASPTLICMEGKPGVFFVGDEVTYIQRIETTATGQNITTDTKQVGVQLRVNGDVSPDGYITLNLHPEVSVLKLTTDQGVTLPIVTRRFTDHIVRVKNGETLVIGGLIRNEEIQEMTRVPFLSDLPILGNLFKHKNKTKDETQVVMFITASVVED